jgi:pantetheine-phosphate adenylyltransferase
MKKIAVLAASCDPPTNGHSWMIYVASKLVDELYVGVGTNPGKRYMFTMDERINMMENLYTKGVFGRKIPIIDNVIVRPFENKYLMNFVDEVSADYIIRGIRNETDYEFERAMMDINNDLFGDGIETIFLMPPKELQSVSSSMVKGLIGYEGWETAIANFVPPNVKEAIIQKVKENATG